MGQTKRKKTKILILILTYNAQNHIESVLERIPQHYWHDEIYDTEVLIIDDASSDDTVLNSIRYSRERWRHIRILTNPVNQRYGGNQKIGYTYAIEFNFDLVVMLHGDGQYPPEYLDQMIEPISSNRADIVFGSRMLEKKDAIKGRMPFYKFLGNIILTKFQNWLLGSSISEFHTGYRAYRIDSLKKIPFSYNSNDFDFDTDIIIQALDIKCRLIEIPIPTHYGDEICRVNGIKYAFQVAKSTLISRVQNWGIFYSPKFDYRLGKSPYDPKLGFDSSHQFAIQEVKSGSTVLDFGCGNGYIAKELKQQKKCKIHGYDIKQSDEAIKYCENVYVTNLDQFDWKLIQPADTILLLDIVEHLIKPEKFMEDLRTHTAKFRPEIIITTGNVVFCLTRLSFLIGQFNYGKRGILDLDHKRLFTFKSLKRLLQDQGYEIIKTDGIPVPIPFIVENSRLADILIKINRLLIKVSKSLFSFQIAIVARPLPTLDQLLLDAELKGRSKIKQALTDNKSRYEN